MLLDQALYVYRINQFQYLFENRLSDKTNLFIFTHVVVYLGKQTYDIGRNLRGVALSFYCFCRTLLKKYIKDNIDYSNITNEPYEKARVYVQILSVTEDGKIDSVNVVRGWDNERDNEAVRVVKSIPEWNVLYRHGEQFNLTWTIPVIFGKEE
jgi:hypothetical protein